MTWAVDTSRTVADPPLHTELDLAPMSGGLLVRGRVHVRAEHTCHRCLDTITEDMEIEVAQLFSDPGIDEDADYEVAGDELDVEPMIRDEVLLGMPLLPECVGECVGPGVVELTAASAEGDGAAPEANPFAVLQDLFDGE